MAFKNRSLFHQKSTLIRIGVFLIILVMVPVGIVLADGGEAGFALSFDGADDYVLLGSTDTILGPGWEDTKTISLWVKPEGSALLCNQNDPGQCDTIFGDRPVWWGISRGIINGEDRIWVWNNPTTPNIVFNKVGVKYTSGEWLHIALVHDNGYLTVYKNGELIDSIESGTTEQPTQAGADPVLHLGGIIKDENENWSYQGLIDELRIYNIALTQTEIQNSIFDELIGDEGGLRAYYRMSDGSGLVLSDDRVLPGGAPVPNPFDGQLKEGTDSGVPPPVAPPPQWVASTAFDKPVVSDQLIEIDEDHIGIPITLTGLDKQNDPLTFDVTHNLTLGTLSGTAPYLTYTPNLNANGTETLFTYTVSDAIHTSDIGRIEIIINAVNDAPVADSKTVYTPIDTAVAVPMTGSDVDGPTLSLRLLTQPQHGYLSGTRPDYVYTPLAGYEGTDSYTYWAYDGSLYSAVATITINVGGAPVLNNAVYLPLLIR